MIVRSPILITGVPRSRTSMVAGCFASLGAWTGQTVGPTKDNPKGFFENLRIREDIIKPYLTNKGHDRLGQINLPSIRNHVSIDEYEESPKIRNKIELILQNQEYQSNTPWIIKDAKLALIWSFWSVLYPNATWVLVRRDPKQIASSCLKTSFMRVHNSLISWESWVKNYEKRFDGLKQHCKVYEIFSQDIIDRNYNSLEATVKSVNLEWDKDKIDNFVIRN